MPDEVDMLVFLSKNFVIKHVIKHDIKQNFNDQLCGMCSAAVMLYYVLYHEPQSVS